MMQEVSFEEAFEKIRAKDPRYHRDAYLFVKEALDYTTRQVCKENKGRPRHVSGQELVEGIREMALSQFGPMVITVFAEWGIHACKDFGEIVFNMIDTEMLAKTDQDSRADFDGVYDFHEAFRKPFLPASARLNLSRGTTPAPAPKADR